VANDPQRVLNSFLQNEIENFFVRQNLDCEGRKESKFISRSFYHILYRLSKSLCKTRLLNCTE